MTTVVDDLYRAGLWPMPPLRDTEQGPPRRLGVELELSGIGLRQIADLMQRQLGGEIAYLSDYELRLRNTALGDFGIELDFAYLKRLGRERGESGLPADELGQLGEGLLKLVAEQIVPFEIVSPPIAMAELWRLGEMLRGLRLAGAQGTRHAPHYAFGLHLNPELPALDAGTILAYMRAFLCLFDWLRERSRVDLSRRLTPYIDPFGRDYLKLLLAPDYAPDLTGLIDDYLRYNPTRNRALDLLPLFAHLDEARVRRAVADPRVKARPTLHYRLPNCDIDNPEWSLAQPWRDWLQVEVLACDGPQLEQICARYREHLDGLAGGLFGDWGKQSTRFLLPELT